MQYFGSQSNSNDLGTKGYVDNLIAPEYDSTATYVVGDFCIHGGDLYKCKTAITTAEAWNSAHWDATTVADSFGDVDDNVNDLKSALDYCHDVLRSRNYGLVTNLFDTNNVSSGYIIHDDGRKVAFSGGYSCLDFTRIACSVVYATPTISANTGKCACYDASYNFIECPSYTEVSGFWRFEIPVNTSYIRWTIPNNKLSGFKIYTDYAVDKNINFGQYYTTSNFITDDDSNITRIDDMLGKLASDKIVLTAENMVTGWYDTGDGSIHDGESNWLRSKYLYPLEEGVKLVVDNANITSLMGICYDANLAFVGSFQLRQNDVASTDLTIFPTICSRTNTAYIGITLSASNSSDLPLTISKYQPKKYRCISGVLPDDVIVRDNVYLINDGRVAASGTDSPYYEVFCYPCENVKSIFRSKEFNDHTPLIFFGTSGIISATSVTEGVSGLRYQVPEGAKYVSVNWKKNAASGVTGYNAEFIAFEYKEDDVSCLYGKKILCIGDSITYLDGRESTSAGADVMIGYQCYLRACGAIVDSSSHNGKPYTDGTESTPSIHTAIVTNQYDVSGYDYIVLFGGSNDARLNVTEGTTGTYASPNRDGTNFCGAIGDIIHYIRTNNPMCKIVLCTILPGSNLHLTTTANGLVLNEKIRELSTFWSVELLDLYSLFNVTYGTMTKFLYDGTHPNYLGFRRIGEVMSKELASCPI